MVYVVQLILSGETKPPKIFVDQSLAKQAFVALVRGHLAEKYAGYCAGTGAEPDSFQSAQAFAETLFEEDTCVYYWEVNVEKSEHPSKDCLLSKPTSESLLEATSNTQQQILCVQTELRNLAEQLTGISQELLGLQKPADEEDKDGPDAAPELEEPAPDILDEKYQTEEWREFIRSITQMCGGNWGEFPLLPRQDWRKAVYDNDTTQQYWDWVAITIDKSINRARLSGYTIEENGEQSGHFNYISPAGERSTTNYEMEDLAWCAAGLHASQDDNAKI